MELETRGRVGLTWLAKRAFEMRVNAGLKNLRSGFSDFMKNHHNGDRGAQ